MAYHSVLSLSLQLSDMQKLSSAFENIVTVDGADFTTELNSLQEYKSENQRLNNQIRQLSTQGEPSKT